MDPRVQIADAGPVDANETEENHANKFFRSRHLVVKRRLADGRFGTSGSRNGPGDRATDVVGQPMTRRTIVATDRQYTADRTTAV